MSMNINSSAFNKEFEPLDDFVERISKEIVGPKSPDPEIGKIFAKHILPRTKHPKAVENGYNELVKLLLSREGK